MASAVPQQNQAALLASLPSGTIRVSVRDEFGQQRFRKPADVLPTDVILLGSDGIPIVMTGAPGRKKKAVLTPTTPAAEEKLRAKEQHLSDDELLTTIRDNPEAGAVFDLVMQGFAEEAASLAFERADAEIQGQPTSQISMRRVNTLKAVADSYLKRKEILSSVGVDLESKAFLRVFGFIMETFKEAIMDAMPGIRPEMLETLFANMSKRVSDENWEKEAAKRMSEG